MRRIYIQDQSASLESDNPHAKIFKHPHMPDIVHGILDLQGKTMTKQVTISVLVMRKQTWKDKVTSLGYTGGKCLFQAWNLVTLTLRTEE